MSSLQEGTAPFTDATVDASTRRHHVQTPVKKQACQYVGKLPPKRRCRSLHSVNASPVHERIAGNTSQTIPSPSEGADQDVDQVRF
ncbi:hypothetical protein L218DRAFT_955060 [Marasmius fiardii PR-910]|nr:hypothetical protein L218DRAFT_955060 [Marasmius fiardii PR-910]